MAREESVTVEQVREAQLQFKAGVNLQKDKKFKEAIEAFKTCASVNPLDKTHLQELTKRLKSGSFKLEQEGIAYMGCAAVHLSGLINELSEDEKEQVPVEQSLLEVFSKWD